MCVYKTAMFDPRRFFTLLVTSVPTRGAMFPLMPSTDAYGSITQYASSITADAPAAGGDYCFGYVNAEGAPNTFNSCGSYRCTAFAPAFYVNDAFQIEAVFDSAIVPTDVYVHEARRGGFVRRVSVVDRLGVEHLVWNGTDSTACDSALHVARINRILPLDVVTRRVRISVTPNDVQIDAIALVGVPAATPPVHDSWLDDASNREASQTPTPPTPPPPLPPLRPPSPPSLRERKHMRRLVDWNSSTWTPPCIAVNIDALLPPPPSDPPPPSPWQPPSIPPSGPPLQPSPSYPPPSSRSATSP